MKAKRLLIILALFLPAALLHAQIGDQRNILSVGVNGGINMNKVSFSPSVKQKQPQGINMGLSVRYISEIYFGMTCGLQVELNYSQHGWSEEYEDFPDLTYKRTMNYVEIPFMAHLAFGKKSVQFFIHAGPQIGFFLSDSYEKDGDWTVYTTTPEQHELEVENKFDYGIAGGGGLELNTKIGHFQLEGRYYYALSDFYGNEKTDYFSRSAHNGITVKLTYLFDLTK